MSRLPPVGRNRTTAPLRGGWQSKAFSLMPCKDVKLYNSGAESCDGQSIHYQESCRVLQTAFAAPWHNTEVMIILYCHTIQAGQLQGIKVDQAVPAVNPRVER